MVRHREKYLRSVSTIILQRLALGLLTLVVVSLVIFCAVEMLPGDFAEAILGQGATPEAVAAIREQLGLDKSVVHRYLGWLGNAVTGDFGVSFARLNFASNFGASTNTTVVTVADQLKPRFINTLFLAGVAASIAVPLSLIIGILAALYRNSVFDRVANIFTLTSISSPEFFVAYILILFLAVLNPWLPSLSNIYETMEFGARLKATLLPALVLTLVVTAHMMRMTRAAIINLLASPYIEMARLKGLSPVRVILFHALPNALAPIINVIALNLAYLITGVVVVEVVFVYPGVGQLFVDSVKIRDIPLVQACCLIFAAAYVLLNLLADVMSIISNPRLRHPK
jgi:peptide/nickel transport system permease protein